MVGPGCDNRIVKKYLRRIGLVVALLFLSFVGATCGYYLKGYEKVRITGTEVKRFDKTDKTGNTTTADVRLIMAQTLDGDTRVYRNVDTGWWPPYLKFDSGEVAGDATNFARDDDRPVVLVTYYGIRWTWFDLYPNVLSLRLVDKDYQPIPVFNIVVLTLLLLFFVAVALGIRRLTRWRPFGAKPDEGPADTAEPSARNAEADESAEPSSSE